MNLELVLLQESFGVCRLESSSRIPEWALRGEFFSITRTNQELSIVALEESIPVGVKAERGWRVLGILGVLDFSLVGVIAEISSILAQESISIFVVSTYDTDYILVREDRVYKAIHALGGAGYRVKGE